MKTNYAKSALIFAVGFIVIIFSFLFLGKQGGAPFSEPPERSSDSRMALFYGWTEEDPLLFSATLDSKKFLEAVSYLKKDHDEFLETYGWQDPIFPLDFLKSFGEAGAAFERLKNDLTEENALALIEKTESAAEAYEKNLSRFKTVIAGLGDTILGGKKYAPLGGETYTTIEIILDDLILMEKNLAALKKEIRERKNCLLVSEEFCRRPLQELAEPELKTPAEKSPPLLSEKELGFKDGAVYRGPYEINSLCWQGREKQYLYVEDQCSEAMGYCAPVFHLATNLYFTRVDDYFPLDRYMKEKGALAIPQSATTYYDCNNLEYQADLSTLDYFYRNYKNDRLFENLKGNDGFEKWPEEFRTTVNDGISAENYFFDSRYPSEDELDQLGEFYGSTYSYLKGNPLPETAAHKDDFLKRYLVIKEKTADIDLTLRRAGSFLASFGRFFKWIEPNPSENYAYPVRSSYSLTYFNFSPDVWRLKEKPRYLVQNKESTLGAESDYMMSYETAILRYGKKNLFKWRGIYNQIDRYKFYLEYRPDNE